MSKPIFVRKTRIYGEIMPNPEWPNKIICVWRRKVTRWFIETISLPAFEVKILIAENVAEALYMAANFAAEITDKRRPGKNAGMPGLPVAGGYQVFEKDTRYVIEIVDVPPTEGGGVRIRIPAHQSLDIPSAVQFAKVINQACDAAMKKK